MHIENVPMHIEGDWHQHFYQKLINLTQGSHPKKQYGGTHLGGIDLVASYIYMRDSLVLLSLFIQFNCKLAPK